MSQLRSKASYPQKLAAVLEEFRSTEEFDFRAQMLIELAEQFLEVPDRIATRPFPATNLVPGCESEAYVWVEESPEGRPKFYFAVENPQGISAKAMAALLDSTLSGESWEAISQVDPEIVYTLFGRNISMGKGRGLMEMVGMIKALGIRKARNEKE